MFIQQKSAGFKSGANHDHVELQHTSAEHLQKGSETVYWEYELLMALWLGTWLWAQAPIVYLQLEVPKVLVATDMREERHGLVNPGPQRRRAEGFLLNHWEKSCINWWQCFFQASIITTWVQSDSYFCHWYKNLLMRVISRRQDSRGDWEVFICNLLFQIQFSSAVTGSY